MADQTTSPKPTRATTERRTAEGRQLTIYAAIAALMVVVGIGAILGRDLIRAPVATPSSAPTATSAAPTP